MKAIGGKISAIFVSVWCILICGCSSTKHVPDGYMLLDKLDIRVDNDSVDTKGLDNFLRQRPNHKALGFAKLQLATYSLSGRDSSKWYNRWLQSAGQKPVIYSAELAEASRQQLRQALINRGYMDAEVTLDSIARPDKKRIEIIYNLSVGEPYRISSLAYNVQDTAIASIILSTTNNLIKPGDLFDRNRLDEYRTNITRRLRNRGYYAFNKDDISFTADTVSGSHYIGLTLNVLNPAATRPSAPTDTVVHKRYMVRRVIFVTDYDGLGRRNAGERRDTVVNGDYWVIYGSDRYLSPSILEEKCHIIPGKIYSAAEVERTYEYLSQLSILKYINIDMRPVGRIGNEEWLDAYVCLSRNKTQGVAVELEGTNSEGDLGFGVGATYQHRNLTKRSDELTAKLRASYESLSGNMEGFINNRYTEYAAEVGYSLPRFEFPFLSSSYLKRRPATTEFTISGNYQERPEYTRIIAGAAWKYKWSHRRGARQSRYNFDLIDINYVRLPKSTLNFLDSIAPSNPLLRYSYEDHFIMRTGISFNRSNKRLPNLSSSAYVYQPTITALRGSVETAGNILYAISSLISQKKNDGVYKIFGIQYAQYVKGEADFTYTINVNNRNAVVFHVGGGLAVPYLNSSMVPFEKRFYAGGANSVRGWSVRSLGPGKYDSKNSVTDFINQCGDIMLNLNFEYRMKLVWVFEGAVFADAGNIWTIRDYENQPGGVFKLDQFYKQIAAAYGVGLRLNFTYFILRFDLGMKAYNPAMNQEMWPLLHPRWKRDSNFHFAVGYPF